MNIRKRDVRIISILILLLIFLAFSNVFAQENAEEALRKGVTYARQGNYDEAIIEFSKAIKIDPNDAYAYYNRGSAYKKKSNYDQAISDYTKAIEFNSDLPPKKWTQRRIGVSIATSS